VTFPAYQEYKNVDASVGGKLPDAWDSCAIKHLVSTPVTDGPHETPNFIDEGVPFVSAEAVSTGRINFSKARFISHEDHAHYSRKYLPRKNDIFIVKSGATTGTVAIVETSQEFNIWSPLAVVRCSEKADPRYVLHCLRGTTFQENIILNWSFGTQQNIGMGIIENLQIPVPSLPEQTQIARFLDHETAKIDSLIHEQKRLIELLKEKRQAVISHAVTKGLDFDVPMKDSGVEWLGAVPAHWVVGKNKWYLETASGGTPPTCNRSEFYDGNIPWLRTLDLNNGEVNNYEVTVTQKAITETSCRIVPKNSVLIAMYGGDGTIGKNGLLCFDSAINQAICAFLPAQNLSSKFLHYFVHFYRPYWMIGAESSRKDPNIGQDRIGDHPLIIPPLAEQHEIVKTLSTQLQWFDVLAAEAFRGVEMLTERRAALISAAVTGKIDVREWQPPSDEIAFDEEVRQAGLEATV